jgi:hypothetical protein
MFKLKIRTLLIISIKNIKLPATQTTHAYIPMLFTSAIFCSYPNVLATMPSSGTDSRIKYREAEFSPLVQSIMTS